MRNLNRIIYRSHALQRMFERGITALEVRHVLLDGEIIKDYPDDQPYPSQLLLGWCQKRPVHIVAAYNEPDKETIIITAYEPDPKVWESGFRRKR